ncbi:kinase-like protein, partial [Wolfiporia cocos MD-104 SS10]
KPVDGVHRWYDDLLRSLRDWSKLDHIALLCEWGAIRGTLRRLYRTRPQELCELTSDDLQLNDDETIFAIRNVLSSREEVRRIIFLKGSAAQSFADLLDTAMSIVNREDRLYSRIFHALRKLCALGPLLPSSYTIHAGNKQDQLAKESSHPVASGGFADVWRGKYKGQTAAIKVFRIFGSDNLEAVHKKRMEHKNIVPFFGINMELFSLCMVSKWMENGCIVTYIKREPSVNRLELLVDAAQGLQYLHSEGVIHGDLKGVNILVDERRRACISDFGLTAVIYDTNTVNTISASSNVTGSARWMAPELLHPEQMDLDRARPYPESGIYSFAMVIWEVFTGRIPYYHVPRDPTVIFSILMNMRPERPDEATDLGLSDKVWELTQVCWNSDRGRRPRVSAVLQTLEEALRQHGYVVRVPPTWPLFETPRDTEATILDSTGTTRMHLVLGSSSPLTLLLLADSMFFTPNPTYNEQIHPPGFSINLEDPLVSVSHDRIDIDVECTPVFPPPDYARSPLTASIPWESVSREDAWF